MITSNLLLVLGIGLLLWVLVTWLVLDAIYRDFPERFKDLEERIERGFVDTSMYRGRCLEYEQFIRDFGLTEDYQAHINTADGRGRTN